MSTFIDRLKEEKVELDSKLEKLELFINSDAFKGIDPVQMSLLNLQSKIMESYSQVLIERIAWLNQTSI
jgi:hypothetical protein